MKLRQATASLFRTIIVLLIVSICVTQTTVSATSKTNKPVTANPFEEKKPLRKEKEFKTQSVVKVYPDAIRKAIHVIARQNTEKEIDFLVFDINGNMVLNYKMKAGERKTISELHKGSYMYHVFCDDEYLTTGKMEFR